MDVLTGFELGTERVVLTGFELGTDRVVQCAIEWNVYMYIINEINEII